MEHLKVGGWTLVVWLLFSFVLHEPARAEFVARNVRGGQIGAFEQQLTAIRASGAMVRIGGNCLSACTLILSLPPNRWCYEPDARLGFHAAWAPDESGQPVTSPEGTKILWKQYSPAVQHWISRNGGLTRKMIFLTGKELRTLYPHSACRGPAKPGAMEAFAYTEGFATSLSFGVPSQ